MGIKEDLVKLRASYREWTSTKEGYRAAVAAGFFLIAWLAVIKPLSGRLATAHEQQESLAQMHAMVAEVRHLEDQSKTFGRRLTPLKAELTWHNYLMDAIRRAEVQMLTVAPLEAESYGNYRRESFEVRVMGDYGHLVRFLDLIERGSRYLRVDELDLGFNPANGGIILNCKVNCLSGTTFDQMREQMMGQPEEFDEIMDEEVAMGGGA